MSYDTLEDYLKDLLKYVDLKLAEYYEATLDLKGEYKLGWQLKHYTETARLHLEKGTIQLDDLHLKVSETLSTSTFLPPEYLIETFKLNFLEVFCLYLSLSVEIDPSFDKNMRYFNESLDSPYPTLGLAIKILAKDLNEYIKLRTEISPESRLLKFFYMESLAEYSKYPLINTPLRLDSAIVDYILHNEQYVVKQDYMRAEYPMDHHDAMQMVDPRLIHFSETNYKNHLNQNVLIHLWGPRGVGKTKEVLNFCSHFEQISIWVDCKRLSINAFNELQLRQISREAIMHRGILVFEHFEYLSNHLDDPQTALFVERLFSELSSFAKVCFVLSDAPWNPRGKYGPYSILDLEMKIPDVDQRQKLWEIETASLKLDSDVDLRELSEKFKMSPGQVKQTVKDAINYQTLSQQEAIHGKDLHKASYLQMSHKLGDRAQRLDPKGSWNQLILPKEQNHQLREACSHVKYRNKVFKDWGFNEKITYGTGLGLLFTGPPGTGKTMAAQIMASELNLEIYRVDLSQVVSKYIGETEKNLKLIFDEAARSSAILLFDEGDALFSKRTEVSDSHDKYANVETSYLLQKIEAYEGISIVTTNLIGNIDEAFIRRFSFVVHFPFPTAEYRRQIWRGIFPENTPLSKLLDLEYMGNRFELSGGNIKNIALNAAFRAAAGQREITMKDLLLSVSAEISKSGKTVLPSDFGEYAYLLTID